MDTSGYGISAALEGLRGPFWTVAQCEWDAHPSNQEEEDGHDMARMQLVPPKGVVIYIGKNTHMALPFLSLFSLIWPQGPRTL